MNVMAKATNLSIDFPIYGSRSFKNTVITGVTGGRIKMSDKTTVIRALEDLNFEFYEGDRIGLVGHNGSGKTTLLRVLTGIYAPSSGSMSVYGSVDSFLNISLGMEGDATGMENIYLRAAMMGMSKRETDEKLDEIIEFSELGDFIYLPFKTYSSGMQMRLAFSISTCVRADIVVMDEWLSVGDASFVKKAQERLNDILSRSKLLVLASHDFNLIANTCNRVLYMEHGNVIRDERTG
jgi:lipopolysaccharide transport system ATP-binding protein